MSNAMTPAQEAAAMWGSAENTAYSIRSRLVYALKALEYFGNLPDKIRETVDEWDAQYTEDDEEGASVNPFYLINDLRKILDGPEES